MLYRSDHERDHERGGNLGYARIRSLLRHAWNNNKYFPWAVVIFITLFLLVTFMHTSCYISDEGCPAPAGADTPVLIREVRHCTFRLAFVSIAVRTHSMRVLSVCSARIGRWVP
jgi:hypothetical protein